MAKQTLLTADQLFELPDDGMRQELVKGELRTMPPAGAEHGIVAAHVLGLLWQWVQPRALGRLYAAETGFWIERALDTVRAPDVAFIDAARVSRAPSPRFSEDVPGLAVEVVSPSDTAGEVQEKAQGWMQAGVRLLWVVYPSSRSVLAYRSVAEVQALGEADDLDGGDVLPGFRCPVRDLFPYQAVMADG
ncbi:MAG: Uma2 family endonuclease [Chloroflexi bacterium]|nr:Uma2 family endonuclease [Chloroflexota bacterium]